MSSAMSGSKRMPGEDPAWVPIARVGRAHGIRGEVRVEPLNPDSTLVEEAESLRWVPGPRARSEARALVVETLRWSNGVYLARFVGVGDRDEAAALTGGTLQVPREQLPSLGEGEYYHHDIIGADVFDEASGEQLGTVRAIASTNVDLLAIRLLGEGARLGDVMVPVTRQYVASIGETPGRVVIRDLDHWLPEPGDERPRG